MHHWSGMDETQVALYRAESIYIEKSQKKKKEGEGKKTELRTIKAFVSFSRKSCLKPWVLLSIIFSQGHPAKGNLEIKSLSVFSRRSSWDHIWIHTFSFSMNNSPSVLSQDRLLGHCSWPLSFVKLNCYRWTDVMLHFYGFVSHIMWFCQWSVENCLLT